MSVAVALSFPGGRFHATPWGHHVNEALPEWPPSPWRFLRTLVAVWKRKAPQFDAAMIETILEDLAKSPPEFSLPPATLGHTRHYMPLDSIDKNKKTEVRMVFDAFVSLAAHMPENDDAPFDPQAEVAIRWPSACLGGDAISALRVLLGHLGYFGRAESWCAARLLSDDEAVGIATNCAARSAAIGEETVRVLTPNAESWRHWAFTDARIVPPQPKWNLLAETADLHLERWSDPPGSKWTTYARRADCFAPRARSRPVRPGGEGTDYVVARYIVDVSEGRRPLPLVTETMAFAEEARRNLGREYASLIRSRLGREVAWDDPVCCSAVLHGKNETGGPATSHRHAFYLPSDEDGDGRIDHLTIYARGGFTRDDLAALDRLRYLSFGKEGEEDDGRPRATHRFLLVGLDREPPAGMGLFGPARVWVSSTPYVAYRHAKTRGTKRDDRDAGATSFLSRVIREDLLQRRLSDLDHLGEPEQIDLIDEPGRALDAGGLGWRHRSLQFRRSRSRRCDDGWTRPFGAFRLTFGKEVNGPISLGFGCHFGLGLFRPEACRD